MCPPSEHGWFDADVGVAHYRSERGWFEADWPVTGGAGGAGGLSPDS